MEQFGIAAATQRGLVQLAAEREKAIENQERETGGLNLDEKQALVLRSASKRGVLNWRGNGVSL